MQTPSVPVIAVLGPTATGKSDLGLAIAESLGGQIVNADAMQLYRGMDSGTAKVSALDRARVRHHQIDVLDVVQEASVAAYQRAARADLAAVAAAGSRGLLVGGSGLYVDAVLRDLQFPATDPGLRAELAARVQDVGPEALHAELAAADPEAAAAIEPGNTRRVVRALEVVRLTGRPFRARLPEQADLLPARRLAIRLDPAVLGERIEVRARRMFAGGLVEEAAALLHRHGELSRTAARAVGYAQALDVIAGRLTQAEALESTILATRRLARRQEKWFRRDPSTHWLDAASGPKALLREALRAVTA